MKYNDYKFIKPCRAQTAIPHTLLSVFEQQGWCAQFKKNGTNTMIFVDPNKNITWKTRHNENHKAWSPTEDITRFFNKLPGNDWYVLNAELLHSKTPHIKNTLYIHDIYVDGEYLIGENYSRRYMRLVNLFGIGGVHHEQGYHILHDNVWLAKNYFGNYNELYDTMEGVENEGLVLKKTRTPLDTRSSSDWLVKCRKSHKNYSF